jgi:tripartite-type tricarboxylate transporter receptor subunit TctC
MGKTGSFMISLIAVLTAAPSINAAEQPYFQGKSITLQVGAPAGGRQDRIARTMARYLTKYTPGNPAFLIQNKTGGQGIPAMLTLSKGPTDGSFMSTVISSYLEAPYFGAPATYEPRNFVYVGGPSTGKQRNVLMFHQRAGIKTLDDLKSREVTLGAQGVGNRSYLYSRLIAEVLGLKVRWVLGYDTQQLYVAIEQGEVQGRVNDAASMMTDKPEWFSKREIVALVAMTVPEDLPPVKHPLFEGIPSIMQFAKNEAHRNIIQKINSTGKLGAALAFPPGAPESIRRIMEEALLIVG